MRKYWCGIDEAWTDVNGKTHRGRADGKWIWAGTASDAACLFIADVWHTTSGADFQPVHVFVSTAKPPAVPADPVLRVPVTATMRPHFTAGTPDTAPGTEDALQEGVREWLHQMTGSAEARFDVPERAARFVEEAIELAQASGLSQRQVLALVKYVFARPVSEDAEQELGGALTCLLALADALGCSLLHATRTELARMWANIDRIREKQRAKPDAVVFTRANPAPSTTPEPEQP